MEILIISGILLLVIGFLILVSKYMVVIGSTVCPATVTRFEVVKGSRGTRTYKMIMGFYYEGVYKEAPSTSSTMQPEKMKGRQVYIHYNPKRPGYVVKYGSGDTAVSILLIFFGVVLLLIAIFV